MLAVGLSLLVVLLCVLGSITAYPSKLLGDKCCVTCDAAAGLEKYYSLDDRFHNCGECCMDPKDYDTYKKFEKGLTKANSSTPCSDLHYTVFSKTETHGAGSTTMTLDIYDKDK